MFVQVNGARLFFDVEGAVLVPDGPRMREKPTLLLLHGGPGFDHSIYKPAFSAVADLAQVIYLDHRGCGRSSGDDTETWNLAQWGDDVRGFCDALGIKRPIVLPALSLSSADHLQLPKVAGGPINESAHPQRHVPPTRHHKLNGQRWQFIVWQQKDKDASREVGRNLVGQRHGDALAQARRGQGRLDLIDYQPRRDTHDAAARPITEPPFDWYGPP